MEKISRKSFVLGAAGALGLGLLTGCGGSEAASSSAASSPEAKLALRQLPRLKGCQVHTSVMLSKVDVGIFKRLGIQLTSEPRYEHKSMLH